MQSPEPPNFLAVSRKQLLLVGVLGVALVAVLVMNFHDASAGATAATHPTNKPARKTAAGQDPAAGEQPAKPATKRWPLPRLADVLRQNPFSVPQAFLEALQKSQPRLAAENEEKEAADEEAHANAPSDWEVASAQLAQQKISAVVGNPRDGYVAIVGSQTIRPGDTIEGFRVIAVQPDGVIVDPTPVP